MSDLERRLAALEAEVAQLREQVTDTHTLAAHADRDVAEFREELRAQTRLLNITREDMVYLRDRMDSLETKVDSGFTTMNEGMARIVALLTPPEGTA